VSRYVIRANGEVCRPEKLQREPRWYFWLILAVVWAVIIGLWIASGAAV
jgi:hypothetical protein